MYITSDNSKPQQKAKPRRAVIQEARREDANSLDLAGIIEQHEGALTVPQLANLLSVCDGQVYTMIHRGTLPHYRIGTVIHLCPHTTAKWLREKKIGGF